jgi:hypothetical protein
MTNSGDVPDFAARFFSQTLSSTLYKIPREFGFVDGADMPRPARIVRPALSFCII